MSFEKNTTPAKGQKIDNDTSPDDWCCNVEHEELPEERKTFSRS